MKSIKIILICLCAAMLPVEASAQIDAIISAVVDAVEPQPVYDTGVIEATQDLASKIERLNRVLFGGAEETSAAYRYTTMYSDLYDLTSTFSAFVTRSYNNAVTLERMYSRLDGESTLHDYGDLINRTWYTYESTVRNGSRIVEQFKKVFSDPNTTNKEVREAAKEAIEEMECETAMEDRRVQEELASMEIAAGLLETAQMMSISAENYVDVGRKEYGDTINTGGSAMVFGSLGKTVISVISLLYIIYAVFTAVHVMKGTRQAENMIARLLIFLVLTVVIILVVQQYI